MTQSAISPRLVSVIAVAVLGAVALLLAHAASEQRRQITALKRDLAGITEKTSRAAATHRQLTTQSASATADLDRLTRDVAPKLLARQKEVSDWLGRVTQLRSALDQKPSQRIPEMQFLTDSDWLKVARTHALDSDGSLRSALGALRDVAKQSAREKVSNALRAHANAHDGKDPDAVAALSPYFEAGTDTSFLARYEMTAHSRWIITERTPIDPDYDSRIGIGRNGGGVTTLPPLAWIEGDGDARTQAYAAYRAEHDGAEPKVEALLLYLEPKLSPERQKEIIDAARVLGR